MTSWLWVTACLVVTLGRPIRASLFSTGVVALPRSRPLSADTPRTCGRGWVYAHPASCNYIAMYSATALVSFLPPGHRLALSVGVPPDSFGGVRSVCRVARRKDPPVPMSSPSKVHAVFSRLKPKRVSLIVFFRCDCVLTPPDLLRVASPRVA